MRIWRCELRKRIYQEFSHSLPFLRVSDVLDFISLGVERTERRNNTISNARQPFRNSSWPQLNSQRISSLATLLICFPPTTSASFFWDYFFEKKIISGKSRAKCCERCWKNIWLRLEKRSSTSFHRFIFFPPHFTIFTAPQRLLSFIALILRLTSEKGKRVKFFARWKYFEFLVCIRI